jgi:hypothetical protein
MKKARLKDKRKWKYRNTAERGPPWWGWEMGLRKKVGFARGGVGE